MMVNISVLQEVTITDPEYATKKWAGYKIRTAAAGTTHCRGMDLLVRENNDLEFTVKNKEVIRPNDMSCEMVTGRGDTSGGLLSDATSHRWTRMGSHNEF